MRARPAGRCAGYHCWSDLLFIHWRLSRDVIQKLLPAGLEVDTFDGDAWVGLVPFHMSGVRPRWFPALPGASRFHETNVRTYVRHRDGGSGVWFFSLDASRTLPVLVARSRWRLNYQRARMTIRRTGNILTYTSRRLWPSSADAGLTARAAVSLSTTFRHAPPNSLERFLVERYVLYTQARSGQLLRGEVHHSPYPLYDVALEKFEETLLRANSISVDGPPEHLLYSPGVAVEVYPLTRV